MGRLANPFIQLSNSSSSVLAGSKWLFTLTGTDDSTDQVFSDADLATQRANPVIADAAGQLPEELYLSDTVIYRLRVTLADGSNFTVADNVTSVTAAAGGATQEYSASSTYNIPNTVVEDSRWWESLTDTNINNQPSTSPTDWTELTHLKFWNTDENYVANDIVQLDGILYRSRTTNTGISPDNGAGPGFTNWANISGIGYVARWVGAIDMIPEGVGPAVAQIIASNDIIYDVLNYDASTDESAQFNMVLPDSWDGGQVILQVYWSANSASLETVVWSSESVCVSDGEDTNSPGFFNQGNILDNNQGMRFLNEAGAMVITPVNATPAGWVVFRIIRTGTNLSDDLPGDASLIGVNVLYKTVSSDSIRI